mmetsp:Transcript_5769/g.18281  ORF Transcript_5769/g.18281 Transcript_5769/m.18281 type:complete len:202 (+) Transcript_5769:140-745(+)
MRPRASFSGSASVRSTYSTASASLAAAAPRVRRPSCLPGSSTPYAPTLNAGFWPRPETWRKRSALHLTPRKPPSETVAASTRASGRGASEWQSAGPANSASETHSLHMSAETSKRSQTDSVPSSATCLEAREWPSPSSQSTGYESWGFPETATCVTNASRRKSSCTAPSATCLAAARTSLHEGPEPYVKALDASDFFRWRR